MFHSIAPGFLGTGKGVGMGHGTHLGFPLLSTASWWGTVSQRQMWDFWEVERSLRTVATGILRMKS